MTYESAFDMPERHAVDQLSGMHVCNYCVAPGNRTPRQPGIRYSGCRNAVRILWRQLPLLAGMFVGIVSQSTSSLRRPLMV